MKKLNGKFYHSAWFQTWDKEKKKYVPYLTKKEALEKLAGIPDIELFSIEKHISGTPLLADGEIIFYLTDGKYKYKLSKIEKEYWDKLKAEQEAKK